MYNTATYLANKAFVVSKNDGGTAIFMHLLEDYCVESSCRLPDLLPFHWFLISLSPLCSLFQEEAIPELEIDVDELLDMPSDDDRGARVKDLLIDCYKPTEVRRVPLPSWKQ